MSCLSAVQPALLLALASRPAPYSPGSLAAPFNAIGQPQNFGTGASRFAAARPHLMRKGEGDAETRARRRLQAEFQRQVRQDKVAKAAAGEYDRAGAAEDVARLARSAQVVVFSCESGEESSKARAARRPPHVRGQARAPALTRRHTFPAPQRFSPCSPQAARLLRLAGAEPRLIDLDPKSEARASTPHRSAHLARTRLVLRPSPPPPAARRPQEGAVRRAELHRLTGCAAFPSVWIGGEI